jgi:hypothetical protein
MKTFLCIVLLAIITFSCQKEISLENIVATLPTLTTTTATSITNTTAASGGNITDDGGEAITARGVCWSTSPNPVLSGSHTSDGTGAGVFTSNITGLTANTVYYVRAYATNSVGTAYGNEITFTSTNTSTALPTVSTASTSGITMTTATSGGDVTNDGGAAVTARGVCWSTTANPTVALSTKTTDGTGTGVFTSAITGLTANTTYHVRAYATNSVGTSYGGDSTFITASAPTIPVITTTAISAITNTTASSGGTISSDGGSPVTVRGVCWSTTANPTTALSTKTTDGTGIGTFSSAITSLTANTTYHVRAYATNSIGTAYGNDLSFTTTGSSTPDVYVAGYTVNSSGNTVAMLWKNGIATALTNGVNDGEARKVFVSGTDVYVVGRESIGSVIESRVWKNGALYNFGACGSNAFAIDIFVSGTDVYVAGGENCSASPNYKLTVWKNGVATNITNGTTSTQAHSLFVSGTDVYVSGEEDGIQKVWKNGVATSIAPIAGATGWENSVHVSGTDVYVAFNSNDPNNVPKMWKNGVVTNLTVSAAAGSISLVHDLYVSGADVYAAGDDPFIPSGLTNAIAASWKNGAVTAITNGANPAGAESVFVLSTNVYVAGYETGIGFYEPRLWKNGVSVPLANATDGGFAFSVFVK